MDTTYFEYCEYDIKIPKALIWKKDVDGYYLDDVVESFHNRKYNNVIDHTFVSLRTDHMQLILPKKKNCMYYLNLDNIINNLFILIEKFGSIHIDIHNLNYNEEDIVKIIGKIDQFKVLHSNRIVYFLENNNENSNMDVIIDIYFNYYQINLEKQKRKSWIWNFISINTKKSETNQEPVPIPVDSECEIKLNQTWEIHFLNHNHGLHILNPEFLDQYYS
uniref:Uncharacterized protein n=1 Tax=viral metagenome TaxID=1070528 RepID=A0A6C0E7X6_9ZZZZ